MAVAVPSREEGAVVPSPATAAEAAALRADDVLPRLGSGTTGLPEDQGARRLRLVGPNGARSQRVRAWSVLASQLRSPLLLTVTAAPVVPAPRHRRRGYRVRRRAARFTGRALRPARRSQPAGPTPVEGNGVNASAV